MEPAIKFILATIVVVMNAVILMAAVAGLIPEHVKIELLMLAVNGAGTAQGIVLNYYFGSSSSSANKDRIIDNMRGERR